MHVNPLVNWIWFGFGIMAHRHRHRAAAGERVRASRSRACRPGAATTTAAAPARCCCRAALAQRAARRDRPRTPRARRSRSHRRSRGQSAHELVCMCGTLRRKRRRRVHVRHCAADDARRSRDAARRKARTHDADPTSTTSSRVRQPGVAERADRQGLQPPRVAAARICSALGLLAAAPRRDALVASRDARARAPSSTADSGCGAAGR